MPLGKHTVQPSHTCTSRVRMRSCQAGRGEEGLTTPRPDASQLMRRLDGPSTRRKHRMRERIRNSKRHRRTLHGSAGQLPVQADAGPFAAPGAEAPRVIRDARRHAACNCVNVESSRAACRSARIGWGASAQLRRPTLAGSESQLPLVATAMETRRAALDAPGAPKVRSAFNH